MVQCTVNSLLSMYVQMAGVNHQRLHWYIQVYILFKKQSAVELSHQNQSYTKLVLGQILRNMSGGTEFVGTQLVWDYFCSSGTVLKNGPTMFLHYNDDVSFTRTKG